MNEGLEYYKNFIDGLVKRKNGFLVNGLWRMDILMLKKTGNITSY